MFKAKLEKILPANSKEAEVMTLEIVWRNPIPTRKPTNSIQRVAHEERLAVYVVSNPEGTEQFEVHFGGAA